MPALYTFQIRVTSTLALDGTTPFAGTFTPNMETGVLESEVVGPVGVFDLHEISNTVGRSLALNTFTVENAQATHTAGSGVILIAPDRVDGSEGTRRTIQDMGGTAGIFQQVNALVPSDHRIAVSTAADGANPGAHTIQFTIGTFSEQFLDQVSGTTAPGDGGSSVAVGLTWTAIQTGVYGAAVNERVRIDPSGGTFTVTAPAAPASGDRFAIKNVTSDITLITVAGNGNNVENPIGSYAPAASVSAGGDGAAVTWSFDGTLWEII